MSEKALPPIKDRNFRGLLANQRVTDEFPGFLSYAQNVYIEDGEVVGRQGLLKMGNTLPGKIQGLVNFVELDGTINTIAFSNGDIYRFDWGTGSWELFDLSAEGVSLSSTARIRTCISRGRLVFTDGINKPVMLEGPMDGSETYTTLTAAPIATHCGVYYDKVFFWGLPTGQGSFEWSDEGDPTSGYAANDQAWDFAQTDNTRVVGMAPLNEVMPVMKRNSATMLMGRVDEEFQTTAVREGLSETEGCISPDAISILEGDVYTLSPFGPRVISKGQVYSNLHRDANGTDFLREIWSTVNRAQFTNSFTAVDAERHHVLFFVPVDTESTIHMAMVWNHEEPGWTTFDFGSLDLNAGCSAVDTSGNDWVLLGDADGNVYKYGNTSVYSDVDEPIELIIRSRAYGSVEQAFVKRLVEANFQFFLIGDTFEGEVRPYIDGEVLTGRRFGIMNRSGKRRYRRGFDHVGYNTGWEIYANTVDQTITLTAVDVMHTIVSGAHGNWRNG